MTAPVVVMIDDNPGDLELVRLAFEESGLAVRLETALDGEQGIRLLERLAGEDLAACRAVLLDLNMPRLNGRAVLRWLRQQDRLRGLPVFVLTSSAVPQDRRECLELGARDYLVKPANYQAYVDLVGGLKVHLNGNGDD